jgi:hypothetical protein
MLIKIIFVNNWLANHIGKSLNATSSSEIFISLLPMLNLFISENIALAIIFSFNFQFKASFGLRDRGSLLSGYDQGQDLNGRGWRSLCDNLRWIFRQDTQILNYV